MAEWTEILKEWFPEWFPEEEPALPFLGEWGTPKANKGEWVDVDTSLELEPKVIHRFIYDVEGRGPFYKNPEELAEDIRIELKRESGLLGDDFQVRYWRYDADAQTFEVQLERIPPFITTPPEAAEPAGAVVVLAVIVAATVITTVVFGYLTLNLTLRNAQKFKEIVEKVVVEPMEAVKELFKEMKPFLYIVAVGFLGAMGSYVFAQIAKARKKA